MENLSSVRTNSSPHLSMEMSDPYDDSALEGVAANVKLLLKLIQDHKDACVNKKNDGRRMLRVAGMMTVLDNIRTRIQKCQSFGSKAELRRCNTDLIRSQGEEKRRPTAAPPADEEETRLRKALIASLAARKSLEVMCSSLGKEKEIMSVELAKKVQEFSWMEELVSDLKAQNETLLDKVRKEALAAQDRCCEAERERNAALRDRNKALSEQLLKSIDGYRSIKRRFRDVQEENARLHAKMDGIGGEIGVVIERIKERIATGRGVCDMEADVSVLEHLLEGLEIKGSKHQQKKG